MKIINPFGPALAKVKVPKRIINKINLEIDKIVLSKKLTKKNDYSKKCFWGEPRVLLRRAFNRLVQGWLLQYR